MRGRTRTVLAVLVVAAMTIAACGDSKKAGSTTDVLRINMASDNVYQNNFNPLLSNAAPGTQKYIYQSLMGVDILKGGEYIPWLAKGYQITPDGKTLTVDLDERATWSDGKPVTSDDVVFTLDLVKKTPELNTNGVDYDTATATDPKKVTITFKAAGFTLLTSILSQYIVPKAAFAGQDAKTFTNANPVGSGPYTLKRFNPQQITLSLRDNYWRSSEIQVKQIEMPVTNSATEVSQLESGQLDLSGGAIPNLITQYVDKSPQNGYFYPTYGALFVGFNLDRAVTQNIHVRRGLSLALDRQQLITLTTQVGANPISQTGLDAATQQKWLDPALAEPVKQDQAAALAEFAQAGYTQKDGKLIDAAGKQLSLTFGENAEWTDSVQRARIIADQLGKVGVNLKVVAAPGGTYGDDRGKGTWDLVAFGFAYGATPWLMYNSMLSSKLAGNASGTPSSYANFGRYRDAATDALLAELAGAATEEQQVSLTRQIEHVMVDQMPVVTLSNITAGCAYSTRNWTGFPSAKDPYTVCAPWFNGPQVETMLTRLRPAK